MIKGKKRNQDEVNLLYLLHNMSDEGKSNEYITGFYVGMTHRLNITIKVKSIVEVFLNLHSYNKEKSEIFLKSQLDNIEF